MIVPGSNARHGAKKATGIEFYFAAAAPKLKLYVLFADDVRILLHLDPSNRVSFSIYYSTWNGIEACLI